MQGRFVKVLTLAVIGLCLLSVRLVPPVWRALMMASALARPSVIEGDISVFGWPNAAAVNRAVQAEKLGVYGDLAAAQHAWCLGVAEPFDPAGIEPWPDQFRRAVRQYPDSPAAHLYLAERLLTSAESLNGYENYEDQIIGHVPLESRRIKMELVTADGPSDMNEAMRSLRSAARLAPDNSAPCYLLAYAYFLMGDNAAAERALAAAVARPGWSLYDLEVQRALLRLYDRAAPTTFYMLLQSFPQYVADARIESQLRSLAHILIDRGDEHRRSGDQQRAVFYYHAAFSFGAAVMAGANDDYAGFMGSWVVLAVGRSLVAPARWRQYAKLSYEQRRDRTREQQGADLQAYFRSVGRADLAAEYAGEFARALRYQRDQRRVHGAPYGWTQVQATVQRRGTVAAVIAWEHAGYILVLLLMTGMASLAARPWKATGAPPDWPPSRWAVIVVLALGLNYVAMLGGPWWRPVGEEISDLPFVFHTASLFAAGLGSPLLLVVAVSVRSLVARRRQALGSRMSKVQGALASLRILLPPTFAVTLLIALILTVPVQMRLQRLADREEKILQVGEVTYWSLGRDGDSGRPDR